MLPQLTRLMELCLEGNRLSYVPAAIGRLEKLKELWLHGNQLTALPDELGRCASLTVLQVHHNRLRELPLAMAALTKLQGLYLQSNELSGLSALREGVLRHMPLQNLGLGTNRFDLSEGFELPGVRVGLAWNEGAPPPHLAGKLTDRFSIVDHDFDAACRGTRSATLLVAFAAQGPGMQQWGMAAVGPLRAAGVALDVLYLVDPSNSYYLQAILRSTAPSRVVWVVAPAPPHSCVPPPLPCAGPVAAVARRRALRRPRGIPHAALRTRADGGLVDGRDGGADARAPRTLDPRLRPAYAAARLIYPRLAD